MSTGPAVFPSLAEIEDQLEQFQSPDERKDDDARADRVHFIVHFWPGDFSMVGRNLGWNVFRPGFAHPVYSTWYPNRHHGRMMPDNLAMPAGMETTKSLAGRAVACVEETYKASFGAVSLQPFTDAGWTWDDVKQWFAELLPRPFDFPLFDQYLHRRKYLVEAKKTLGDPVETASLDLVVWSNDKAREALRKWGRERISAAKKAATSGVGDVVPTDRELDWFMLAGMGVPKAMCAYTDRTDLLIADDDAPQASDDDASETAETLKVAVETMAQMQQMFALQMAELAQTRAPVGPDPEVEALRAQVAELKGLVTQLTDTATAPKAEEPKAKK